jgi:hypothetical protein
LGSLSIILAVIFIAGCSSKNHAQSNGKQHVSRRGSHNPKC